MHKNAVFCIFLKAGILAIKLCGVAVFFAIYLNYFVSRSPTVRLNTGCSGVESLSTL